MRDFDKKESNERGERRATQKTREDRVVFQGYIGQWTTQKCVISGICLWMILESQNVSIDVIFSFQKSLQSMIDKNVNCKNNLGCKKIL